MTAESTKPWGKLPEIDPNPGAPMCGVVNGNIICCRSTGHAGAHATPFPSKRRHGPVWVYWGGPPLGPFGSCHHGDPATHLYCGLEKGHDGDHLAPSNQGGGATLAEWDAEVRALRASRETPTGTLADRTRRFREVVQPGIHSGAPYAAAAAAIRERFRSDFERIYAEEAPTMTESERALARKFVDQIAEIARDAAAGAPPDGEAAPHNRDLALDPKTGDYVWCRCGDAIRTDDAVCGNCHFLRAPRPPAGAPDPDAIRDAVLRGHGDGQAEGFRDGVEAALREVNAMKQRNALARERAAAAGRASVASHRQTDVETCEQIDKRLRALDAAPSPSPGDPADHNEKE